MSYPIPSYAETMALLRRYASYSRSTKIRARAQIEYLKSIVEKQIPRNT